MLKYLIRKMQNKKGIMLSLLIGNIFLVSILCCNSIYTQASLKKMIRNDLNEYMVSSGKYPMIVTVSSQLQFNVSGMRNQEEYQTVKDLVASLPEQLGIPEERQIRFDLIDVVKLLPSQSRNGAKTAVTNLCALSDFQNHIKILDGEMPSETISADGYIEVAISEKTMVEQGILLGDEFTFEEQIFTREVVGIRVTAIFDASDASDVYWVREPSLFGSHMMMMPSLFEELLMQDGMPTRKMTTTWYEFLDYTELDPQEVTPLLAASAENKATFKKTELSSSDYSETFSGVLSGFETEASKVTVTLWILQIPVFMLLVLFIFMVSKQILNMEDAEIAIMKSRGASGKQIITLYFLQSLILAFLGLLIGIPLSFLLCQVVGSSNEFLEFVSRKALPVQLNLNVILIGLAAAAFSVLVMTLPVFAASRTTIVVQKRKKMRQSSMHWWQKSFIDVILIGLSLYGLYNFNQQKEALATAVADGAALDPVLYLCSSLFILGAGLFALRFIPLLARFIFWLGKKWWSPAWYSSFISVIRTRKKQGFIMMFLIFTIALGVFNAKSVRTINANEEQRLEYITGADIVLKEQWSNNAAYLSSINSTAETVYNEPDFNKYLEIDGVESAAKVYREEGLTINNGGLNVGNITLMAIHTKSFGETARFDTSLLPTHWYNYLNDMSTDPNNIIVSSNFQENFNVKIGDRLTYKTTSGTTTWGKVVAFVDYWPGYNPYSYQKGADGVYKQNERYLIVAHLSKIQSEVVVKPYEVWLKVNDHGAGLVQAIEDQGLKLTKYTNLETLLTELKNDPVIQGTNGVSTVSFIVILMLCAAGFLIFWLMSIHGRQMQFGVFRAMGMSMREILIGLINEQLLISVIPMGVGAFIGLLASRLFIPLIQITYASYDQPLPLQIAQTGSDLLRLLIIVALVMIACLVVLGWFISKIKVSQALKLGED